MILALRVAAIAVMAVAVVAVAASYAEDWCWKRAFVRDMRKAISDVDPEWKTRYDLVVLVCGGRDYPDRARVWRALDELGAKAIIVGRRAAPAFQWMSAHEPP